jgi:hypothetical protein
MAFKTFSADYAERGKIELIYLKMYFTCAFKNAGISYHTLASNLVKADITCNIFAEIISHERLTWKKFEGKNGYDPHPLFFLLIAKYLDRFLDPTTEEYCLCGEHWINIHDWYFFLNK